MLYGAGELGSVVVVEPGKPAYTKQIAFMLESLQREVDGYIEAKEQNGRIEQ